MGRHRARRTIAAALCAVVALLAVPATAAATDAPDDPATTTATTSTTEVELVETPDVDTAAPVDDAAAPVEDAAVEDAAVEDAAVEDAAVEDEVVADEPAEDPGTTGGSEEPQHPTEPSVPTEPTKPTVPTEPSVPTEPAELPGPAPTIEAHCWMGHHQPVYVLHNLDREHALRYVLSAPGAGKRGQLTARGDGRDSVWFVGTGSFPNPSTVRAEFEIGGASGSVVAPEVLPAYCTYAVRPIVRWLDADLNDLMPTAEQVAGWSLELDGALGSLDCTWNGAGLTCRYATKADGPLPDGSYYSLGRETELRVPAFGDTSFTVRASADPAGFRLADGIGETVLPDVGDGLDQSSIDDRAGWFFPARLQSGRATQVLTVTFESIDVGPTEVRGTSTARPEPTVGVVPVAVSPGSKAPRGASGTAPAFTLPATGGAPMGLVGLGLALLLLGLGAGLVATRTARREPS